MSEVLELAQQLRLLTDDQLVALVRQRMLNTSGLKDFFDLADALLQPKNMQAWIAGLTADEIETIKKSSKTSANTDPLTSFLMSSDTFVSTLSELQKSLDRDGSKTKPSEIEKSQVAQLPKQQAHSDGGIRAFETCQAITEVIYDLEQHRVKLVGKSGIAIGELKRLAAHLGKSVEDVRETFEIAANADLISTTPDRWVLNSKSADWLEFNADARWQHLCQTWLGMLGAPTQTVLAKNWGKVSQVTLENFLCEIYPFASIGDGSRFAKVCRFAESIGLTTQGHANEWLQLAVESRIADATKALAKNLPEVQSRIIVQGDLSIIAPGPLSNKDERELRAFVETEQAGLASRYRISALSISQALETSITASDIGATLTRLSGTALPQPVEYLIADTVKRFGRIRVTHDVALGGSRVFCEDSTMCAQLANEAALRAFGLRAIDAHNLRSKYDSDVVYFGLREIGHLAIRTTATGELVSPLRFGTRSAQQHKLDGLAETIALFRTADARVAHSGDDEAMLRQIQLALKNKAHLQVSYLGKDGTLYDFLLEPVGVANGRLRARDRKADLERTLPLANITKLELA
jgi:hypothetical protein